MNDEQTNKRHKQIIKKKKLQNFWDQNIREKEQKGTRTNDKINIEIPKINKLK